MKHTWMLGMYRAAMLAAAVAMVAAAPCSAQDDDPNAALSITVKITARRYADSVVLRWAPEKALAWRAGTAGGYTIERAALDRSGKPGAFERLGSPVMPWTDEQWTAAAEVLEARAAAGSAADSVQGVYMQVAQALLEQSAEVRIDAPGDDDLKDLLERKSQFEMQYGMALLAAERSPAAAQGLGLRYADRTARAGQAYVYRITLLGRTEPYNVAPGEIRVGADVYRPPTRKDAVGTAGQDGLVVLQWRAFPDYSGYVVDRSEGGAFRRMTSVPIVTLRAVRTDNDIESYVDTGLVNGRRYTYRVIGMTAFGDEELVGEVVGVPRDRVGPGMPTVQAEHMPPRAVKITWSMAEPVASDLVGFHIGRDTADEGAFKRITSRMLPAGAREFTDTVRSVDGPLYYRVEAVDSGGNASRSFSAYVTFVDSTPPGTPRWVSGLMDTNGVVRLTFRPNPERDVMGYRVLRANDPEHEFAVVMESFSDDSVSRARDTVLSDTVEIRTLTKYVYYRLIALDYHHNESELSTMLAVPRPDVVPPVPPIITGSLSTDTSVVLEFAPSSSRDVKRHIVQRRREGAERWDSVASTGREDSLFIDLVREARARYEYALLAVDSAGLRSELSNTVTAEIYDSGVRPPVVNLAAAYDSTKGTVRLSWTYPGLREPFQFIVYRASDGAPLATHAVVKDAAARSFVEIAPAGARIEYAVKVVAASGAESRISERALVQRMR